MLRYNSADEIVITEDMIKAATEVLNDSGILEFGTETSSNWPIVEEMFKAAFHDRIFFVRKGNLKP